MRTWLEGSRFFSLLFAAPLLFSACSGTINDDLAESAVSEELSVPTRVRVNGVVVDVEGNYLPRVVQCENPGAPLEALKAQAVAARTYLSFRAAGRAVPTIVDGQSDQVYTCPANLFGRFVSEDVAIAVRATAGEVVMVDGALTAGFFVAGSRREEVSCRKLADATNTERFLTFNFGVVGPAIVRSSIGSSKNAANRGCFGQNLANCLATANEYDYKALLRYFYGSDAHVGALGGRVPTQAEIIAQAERDYSDATCYSSSFGRPVPEGACVQSAADRLYHQCTSSGSFSPAAERADGELAGAEGRCTELFDL